MTENSFELDYILMLRDVKSKGDILQAIARSAAEHTYLKTYTPKDIESALKNREKVGSTGFGGGFAIPHCSLPNAEGFVTGVAAIPGGVPFDTQDGKDITLAFFIIGPESQRDRHVELLSKISRLLADPAFLQPALSVQDEKSLGDLIKNYAPSLPEVPKSQQETSLMHIFVQREELLSDILQTLSTAPYGSFSVVEMKSAGTYMKKLPLFAAFWTDSEDSGISGHLIIAVVDSRLCNDLIRRIRTVVDKPDDPEDLLVTVQQTTFTYGKLRF